jgi:glucose-6-phosphate-specific signal transduction histidine kinase
LIAQKSPAAADQLAFVKLTGRCVNRSARGFVLHGTPGLDPLSMRQAIRHEVTELSSPRRHIHSALRKRSLRANWFNYIRLTPV